jgi:hypothetical protein
LGQCAALLRGAGLELKWIEPAGLLHVPRLNLPQRLYLQADRLASSCQWVSRLCENPILVAQIKQR